MGGRAERSSAGNHQHAAGEPQGLSPAFAACGIKFGLGDPRGSPLPNGSSLGIQLVLGKDSRCLSRRAAQHMARHMTQHRPHAPSHPVRHFLLCADSAPGARSHLAHRGGRGDGSASAHGDPMLWPCCGRAVAVLWPCCDHDGSAGARGDPMLCWLALRSQVRGVVAEVQRSVVGDAIEACGAAIATEQQSEELVMSQVAGR